MNERTSDSRIVRFSFLWSQPLRMPYLHLRLSVPHPPINHVPNLLRPLFGFAVERTFSPPFHVSFVKKTSSSFARLRSVRALQISADVLETSDVDKYCQSKFGAESSEEHTFSEEVHSVSSTEFAETFSHVSHRESERRRKIGLANKGRVPWNKGLKHSAETRERIKQKTIEALRDPKVRKKMAESSRAHSDQTKARIGSSLRRVWGKRLNFPRLREKFFLSWAASIARAAKKGGSEQKELDWDSYDKIKEEVALQKLQRIADKANAKEMAKLRAEKAAQAEADKMVKLAQKKKEWEENAKARGKTKRKRRRKSKEDKEEFAAAQELKLKERLTKIHKKKPINISTQGKTVNSEMPPWEKVDLEFIKREQTQRKKSLADQIRAAKKRRTETAANLNFHCLQQQTHSMHG